MKISNLTKSAIIIFAAWILFIVLSINVTQKKLQVTKTKDEIIDSLQQRIHELESRPMFTTFYLETPYKLEKK